MRRFLLLVSLLLLATVVVTSIRAAVPASRSALHLGDHGQRVKDLQWLLSGGKPSAYSGVRTLDRVDVNGTFGQNTATAVVEMKRRLGFPTRALQPIAGADLFEILKGQRARPLGYIARATARLADDKQIVADKASSDCAQRLIAVEQAEIGVHEIPDGSNDGARVREYQTATGAFRAAWCASFQAWAYRLTHIGFPASWDGFIGSTMGDSAGVFAIVRNAQARGWIRAIPKPGYLSAWTDRLGHIGLVERVFYSGFNSLEGNASNSVMRRFHPFGSRPVVFIAIPGCDGG